MSIQAECRRAVHRLAARGEVFTEIDVANEASSSGWSGKHFEQAVEKAYNVVQDEYSKGKLVRYGPVDFRGNLDYARRGTKIVYADVLKGPEVLETPNGKFPRLSSDKDNLARAGRRSGTNRDDTKPWGDQIVTKSKQVHRGPPVDAGPLLKRIETLEAENRRLKAQPVSNGNGKHESVAIDIEDLADLLESRMTEKVIKRVQEELVEKVRSEMAEALIPS
jgi:hypothetical protein